MMGHARAAQMTERSLTISSAVVSASGVSYTFGFKLGTAGQVQSLKFEACTTALGSCTAPSSYSVASATYTSKSGWSGSTNFALSTTNTNDCDGTSASIICLNRTDTTSENTSTAKTIIIGGIVNPSTTGTFFIRMTTYSTNNFTVGGIVDSGTIASSTTATLTITAQVAEVLNFCIGATSVNDTSSSPGSDCSAISGTTVNLGTLDSSTLTTTPVSTSTNGNNLNGIAMVRTNASNGTTISYRALQQSGTNHQGAMRVVGATCNASTINTDQCINSAGTTQTTFSAGTEKFGFTVGGVNCGSTTAYSCDYVTSGDNHLSPEGQYDGSGFTSGSANTYGTAEGFAWDESGSFDQIAASSGSTSAVDDEALILRFAATPNIVTPTGSYQAQADFVVIATY